LLNDLRHTAKHIIVYSLGNLSIKLIGFVLLPLYTGFLSTDEYGMLAILEVTSFMLIALVGMRQSTSMMRWCSSEKDEEKIKVIAFTVLTILIFFNIAFNLIFQPLSASFSRLLFDSESYQVYFRVLFVYVSFEILDIWVLDLIRIKGKPSLYVILTLIKFTTVLFLISILLNIRDWAFWGLYSAS